MKVIENAAEDTLRPGDVVWANRKAKGLPYNHCGIYIGDGRVIHFAAPEGAEISMKSAVIHETSFEHFQNNCEVKVIDFPESPYTAQEVVERARSRLGERGYNFFVNNCDHFAVWCKTGKHESLQVDKVKDTAQAIGDIAEKYGNKKLKSFINTVFDIHSAFEKTHDRGEGIDMLDSKEQMPEEGNAKKHNVLDVLDGLVQGASGLLDKLLTSVLEDKELSYEDVMKYFMEHQNDDPKIARGAMFRDAGEKGHVVLTQVFLDKDNALVCGKDEAPLGRKIQAVKLDAELLKLFKDGNAVLVG